MRRFPQKHANFIINHGAARAADLERLIEHVRRRVRARARRRAPPRGAHRGSAVGHATHLSAASLEARQRRARVRPRGGALRRGLERAGNLAALGRGGARGLEAPRGRRPCLRSARPARSPSSSARRFERVWIALHGPGGEDGTLQGALEYLGMPYTGSGVMGSAIGMDKLRTKRLAQAVGVPTADFVVLQGRGRTSTLALERLKLPLIVKPATQGSSVGMTKVERAADLSAACADGGAARFAGVRRGVDRGQGVHGRDAAGRGAALDPHRDAADLLRLRGEVLPRRHALLLPLGPVAARRGAPGEPRTRRLRGRGGKRLGACGLHDGRRRPAAAARDQHRSRA